MTKRNSILVGLTGSIGMGKSTAAGFFADLGAAVWDADEAVHRLYSAGGQGAKALQAIAPDCVDKNGVNRKILGKLIQSQPDLLPKIEALIHPLVAEDRQRFREVETSQVLIFDIPLLFENKSETSFDFVVVVSCKPEVQRARVLAREGMTKEKFEFILAKQMPDMTKRAHADFVIETDVSLEDTKSQVLDIYQRLLA